MKTQKEKQVKQILLSLTAEEIAELLRTKCNYGTVQVEDAGTDSETYYVHHDLDATDEIIGWYVLSRAEAIERLFDDADDDDIIYWVNN